EARAKGYTIEDNGLGNLWVVMPREAFKEEMVHYKALGFNYLADIVGLDYLEYPDPRPERFAVVYELVSLPGWQDGDGSRFFLRVY
ncbi:NADH-quinone oxidoreductase subunit C, partial [Acinetobacter baumannii]